MSKEGKLDKKTKDIIAFTVSIMSGCEYCIGVYIENEEMNKKVEEINDPVCGRVVSKDS